MADENVRNAQIYLNAMYGHRTEWKPLEENGYTGTIMMEAVIRAFQIQNGLDAVGEVGPATLAKFKSLRPISKMDPNDESSPNVCILQCALFCKGYATGGITGIYYTSGVNAVRQLQSDANIGVTGIIDWKVWAALLSFNWFTEPANPLTKWDPNIRLIQRQLNSEYSDYINVRACDGIMSRETALSVLGALQAAEGILSANNTITNLNELNFGERTKELFPEPLGMGNTRTKFNKLIQYGLYFNGYHPGNFNGNFDGNTHTAVGQFQKFYALENMIDDAYGVVGVSTMMSLLLSRGDIERPARACDCSTILNQQQVTDLKTAGYRHIGRYLTGTVGNDFRPKALTVSEIKRLVSAGLAVFPIYQDGGYYLNYFTETSRGASDATIAIQAAKRLGFPYATTIYFAVDFDCLPYQTEEYIVPYFSEINAVFNTTVNDEHYKVGVYGPRQVCSELFERMLSTSSFVADMSSGFTGNCGYPLPKNWSFDQFWENVFLSSPSFDLDKVAVSADENRDKGCLTFNEVTTISDQERIKALYRKNMNKFAIATAAIDGMFSYEFDFTNGRVLVAHAANPAMEVNMYLEASTGMIVGNDKNSIPITIGVDGEPTLEFGETVRNMLSSLGLELLGDSYRALYEMALEQSISIAKEMGKGSLVMSWKLKNMNSYEISMSWECDDLYLSPDEENGQGYTLTQHIGWVAEVIYHTPEYVRATEIVKATTCAMAVVVVGAWFLPEALTAGLVLGGNTAFAVSTDIITELGLLVGILQKVPK